MRLLRGKVYSTKVATFLFLAFALSSVLTIASPRPTYAEGPLLGTVRCLLGTVLLQKCQPGTSPANTTPATPANNASGSSSNSSNASKGNSSSGAGSQAAPTTGSASFKAPKDAEIALPKDTEPMAPAVQGASAPVPSSPQLSGAEQLAFFNTHSRYARDVQSPRAGVAPLETSAEGWKIVGVAWYWWAMLLLAGVVILTSVKRSSLRKASAL